MIANNIFRRSYSFKNIFIPRKNQFSYKLKTFERSLSHLEYNKIYNVNNITTQNNNLNSKIQFSFNNIISACNISELSMDSIAAADSLMASQDDESGTEPRC